MVLRKRKAVSVGSMLCYTKRTEAQDEMKDYYSVQQDIVLCEWQSPYGKIPVRIETSAGGFFFEETEGAYA